MIQADGAMYIDEGVSLDGSAEGSVHVYSKRASPRNSYGNCRNNAYSSRLVAAQRNAGKDVLLGSPVIDIHFRLETPHQRNNSIENVNHFGIIRPKYAQISEKHI